MTAPHHPGTISPWKPAFNEPPPRTAPPSHRLRLPRWLTSRVVERVVALLVLVIALALLWSAVTRLSRLREESRTLSSQFARLSGDIDLMRAQWTDARTRRVTERLPAAESSLFQGPPAFAEWMDSIRAEAVPLALETEFEFVNSHTQALDRVVTVMQARLRIRPNSDADAPRPTYQRLLALGRHLAEQPRRLDVIQFDIHGSSNSVEEASAVLEVWAGNVPPFAP